MGGFAAVLVGLMIVGSYGCFAGMKDGRGTQKPVQLDSEMQLFVSAAPSSGVKPPGDPAVIRTRLVSVRIGLLDPGPAAPPGKEQGILHLNLFPDADYRAALVRRERISDEAFIWFGRVEGEPQSEVTISVNGLVVAGNIRLPGGFFQIRYVGEGVHAVHQIDAAKFPPELQPVLPETPGPKAEAR